MNKNVEFLYKLLNEYYLTGFVSKEDAADVRKILGDLANVGDTDKERYVNITSISNVYCLITAELSRGSLSNCKLSRYTMDKIRQQLSLTYFCKNALDLDLYLPMYLKLALEDILNFLWNPKVMSKESTYNDINVSSSSLDLYLDSAVDDYIKFKECISKTNGSIREPSAVKTDGLTIRKDSTGEVFLLEPSIEFTLLLNKFNIEYIISLLIIVVIAMYTTSKFRA